MAAAAAGDERRFQTMVKRRRAGEPLQYILGTWSFRRLELTVDQRVLIPRPETEQVVEAALRILVAAGRGGTVVDLGTGSGAIAISIATERPGTEVWATDVSKEALEVARLNDREGEVRFVHGDWWRALPAELRGNVDLVISNPPYIASGEMSELDPQVRHWEPTVALEAGERGTEAIEAIIEGGRSWLREGGYLVVELAPHQAAEMAAQARREGYGSIEVREDLAGRARILVAKS
jgi:release factor glutamine methyltransferase